ncbi:MAG: glycosyl transferase family 2 [Algoriphagus sp.]|uniref:glycosyltransferase family 2 protein n=1 Tax=Algoriphagus sp. TaxID=1872435 RepID=UPI000C44716F|nr:glycosyltransferase family 2 protein [Algoriphagus sp.]MAL15723.1 glycosyl transferase family 2 [Algoriphagus sp.]
MNILIPMAGKGSRFRDAGFKKPKPLIDVDGKPMIKWVVDNIGIDGKYIFIVQEKHLAEYPFLEVELRNMTSDVEIVTVDQLTEGAACTALLAENLINNNEPLLICNSDQWVDWNSDHFLNFVKRKNCDGALLSFFSDSPKHSYARYNYNTRLITEVAEKQVISNFATVGIYYWKSGASFVECTKQMIDKNLRVNNEFYLCPAYNELIFSKDGKVELYPICDMRGMGTPKELERFLSLLKSEGV